MVQIHLEPSTWRMADGGASVASQQHASGAVEPASYIANSKQAGPQVDADIKNEEASGELELVWQAWQGAESRAPRRVGTGYRASEREPAVLFISFDST